MILKILNWIRSFKKFNSSKYWESRYSSGGNSGDGSYGRLAFFKADVINNFISNNHIQSATELGCGDGNQLSIINYPKYLGLDVSASIIESCKQKFTADPTKKFVHYDPTHFKPSDSLKSELSLSLDVLYHIIEDDSYFKHLDDLFALSKHYVIIYSTDFDEHESEHVFHRKFTAHIKQSFPDWRLIEYIKNPYYGIGEQESKAEFFIYANNLA